MLQHMSERGIISVLLCLSDLADLTLQTITLGRIRPVTAEVMTLVNRHLQVLPGVVSSPVLMAATIPLSRVLLLLCSSSADPVTLLKTPLV